MKKKLAFFSVLLLLAAASAFAQGGAAQQQVALQLNPAIEISSYSNINISSNGTQFRVRANKQFNISVSAENAANDLQLAIKDNETGGLASSGYMAYAPVQGAAQGLLTNCAYGNDQSFAVNYKAGKSRDAVLVYTATQP